MKDPRNPNAWTNREIEQDSVGYVAAQEAHRRNEAVAADRRAEERDRDRFVAAFVKEGGSKADALDAYRKCTNERAAEAIRTADEAADEAAHREQRYAVLGAV